MAAAQPSKFTKVSKTLDRVKKAARVENDARETLVTQVRADYDKFLERERKRCYLVGSWILHQIPAWFAASDRQAGFLRWLNADRTRKKSAFLFGPEADSGSPDACEGGCDGRRGRSPRPLRPISATFSMMSRSIRPRWLMRL